MCGRYVAPDEADIERFWHLGRDHNPLRGIVATVQLGTYHTKMTRQVAATGVEFYPLSSRVNATKSQGTERMEPLPKSRFTASKSI